MTMRDPTPEELAKLEVVTSASAQHIPKFAWDDTFQRKLMGMLLTDHFMLLQSMDKIRPEYFSNESHVLITKILLSHFHEHKAIPEKWIIENELNNLLKDRDKSVSLHFLAELTSVYDYYVPGIDTREYLLDKVTSFAKVQAVKVAFHNSLEKMQEAPEDEKTWNFVYEQMRQAMLVDRSYEPGVNYFLQTDEMFKRMDDVFQGKDRFTSGFAPIDQALVGGGLFPGQIASWIGLPGTGKSLALCKCAVANVMLGHRVLYLTLEMNELGIMQRFTSQFAKLDINNLRGMKDEVYKTIENFKTGFEDPNLLHVKQFPGGEIDVNGICSYLAQLELRKFKPNLIIVDYVGEMKHNSTIKKYESAFEIIRDLRGFGVRRNHCTFTCVQPNASAAKLEIGQYIDESNIGTAFDQLKPMDALWSINQQVIEKDAEVGRGFVIKHRDGRSRFAFKLGFDYKLGTLDMFDITNERYRSAMNLVQEKKADGITMDNVNYSKKSKKFQRNSDSEPDTYEVE